ncbi:MAG: Yip1 family protein [Acidobacteriota bacterium]
MSEQNPEPGLDRAPRRDLIAGMTAPLETWERNDPRPLYHPERMFQLFVRPRAYFQDPHKVRRGPYAFLLALVAGIAWTVERLALGPRAPITSGWPGTWMWGSLVGLGVGVIVIWFLRGFWWHLRLRWSGASRPRVGESQAAFAHTTFVWALPTLVALGLDTFTFAAPGDSAAATRMWSLLAYCALLWSCYVSYRAARSLFQINRRASRLWFLYLPLAVYLITPLILAYLGWS